MYLCILNNCITSIDPFRDASIGVNAFDELNNSESKIGKSGFVHIRIQQRQGRKTLTTVQGINDEFDKKKLLKAFKKEFACNGTVVEHLEYGEVIQLQGDQRQNVFTFLTNYKIVKEEQIKVKKLKENQSLD